MNFTSSIYHNVQTLKTGTAKSLSHHLSILPRSNHHMIFKFLISFRKTDEDKMA